jgi:sugar phosphate permease
MKFLPFEHRGRGTGIWQGTFALGQFIVGMSFPALAHAVGGDLSHAVLVVGAVAVIAALIALVMAIRTHGRIAPAD